MSLSHPLECTARSLANLARELSGAGYSAREYLCGTASAVTSALLLVAGIRAGLCASVLDADSIRIPAHDSI
jgi:hypothetical protein